MKYTNLPKTDTQVSKICLGTMMWGDQVSEKEAFLQMDYALEKGVNFWDTAEMYTIPTKAETHGNSERIIGNYFEKNKGVREKIILATKFIGGQIRVMDWIRDGKHCGNEKNIKKAFEDSCTRLKTDYIDLYQMHWPDRPTSIFGNLHYKQNNKIKDCEILETAQVLKKMVDAGKIRFIGISNESAWGTMQWVKISKEIGLPLVTIQNPYNLLNRSFEFGLSEIILEENLGLLPYSPLGMGVLSGKYLKGNLPKGSRREIFSGYAGRYNNPQAEKCTQKLFNLATSHDLNLAQMSLAFINQQNFVTANIIGATNLKQLEDNINSIDLELSEEVLNEIEKITCEFPVPCP